MANCQSVHCLWARTPATKLTCSWVELDSSCSKMA
jgi:hypothetical protein